MIVGAGCDRSVGGGCEGGLGRGGGGGEKEEHGQKAEEEKDTHGGGVRMRMTVGPEKRGKEDERGPA